MVPDSVLGIEAEQASTGEVVGKAVVEARGVPPGQDDRWGSSHIFEGTKGFLNTKHCGVKGDFPCAPRAVLEDECPTLVVAVCDDMEHVRT